jgi:WD40 repeat protein
VSTVRLAVALEGHTAPVRSLAFSRDGTTLASAADDGTVRVWDSQRGDSKVLLTGHRGALTLGLSREGRSVATAGPHEALRLWDVHTGLTLSTLPRPGAGSAAFASLPDRESLAVAMEQRVFFWDVPSGAIRTLALERFPHDQLYYPQALAFSPDCRTLATASTSMSWERGSLSSFESVRLWEIPSGRLKMTLPPTPPMGTLAFSSNGALLAAGQGSQESPHEVHVWHVSSGRSLTAISAAAVGSRVDALAFSPDERALLIGVTDFPLGRVSVLVLDLSAHFGQRHEPVARRLSLSSPAKRLAISPDGTRVASAGDPNDHAVRVWSVVY